jgi:hypothetical protein
VQRARYTRSMSQMASVPAAMRLQGGSLILHCSQCASH